MTGEQEERRVRSSQALSPFGVGAIFDHLGESFVACDTTRWLQAGQQLSFDRLAAKLGVNGFRTPPFVTEFGNPVEGGLPYFRFPRWLFCGSCRKMWEWPVDNSSETPLCGNCPGKRRLVPMRFVMICRAGHLGDVDWPRWAHSTANANCGNRGIEFRTRKGVGGGLASLEVRCLTCGSSRNLDGLTAPGAATRAGMGCPGRQPWQGGPGGTCGEEPLVVQRGASNVHYAQMESALDIPPGSDYDPAVSLGELIQTHGMFPALIACISPDGNENLAFRTVLETMLKDLTDQDVVATAEDVRRVAFGIWNVNQGNPPVPQGDQRIDWEEWLAFLKPQDGMHPLSNFITEQVDLAGPDGAIPRGFLGPLSELIDSVILARTLREIRVLKGFSRLYPPGDDPTGDGAEIRMVSPSLGRPMNWLPANETRGEGIFVQLNEEHLVEWENQGEVRERVDRVAVRLAGSRRAWLPAATPRLIAIHSLAHLLIRELIFECGYESASLRERLYVDDSGDTPMAGFLIYTASGTTEGSLGGLVRQGEPPRFARTVLSALHRATWCPADPVCSENAGGLDSLNFAACHACSLVSETSCEHSNLLLDRDLVVGELGLAHGVVQAIQGG